MKMSPGFEAGFQIQRGRRGPLQQFLDARDGISGCCGACLDGFTGPVEIVPGQGLHIGAENEVRMALPDFELMFLRGADGAAYDLEDIRRSAAMAVLNADGNGEHAAGAELPRGVRRNGGNQPTVGQAARADLDWFEKAGEGATRADGINQIALSKDHRFSSGKVCGHDGHRNVQFFEASRLEDALDEVTETVIAGEAQARDARASDIAEAQRAASCDDARQGCAAGVRRSENAADARAGDGGDRNWVLLEDLQDAEVSEPAGEAAAEGEIDACPQGRGA